MLKACLRHEARSEMTRWWMLNAQTLHHLSSRNFAQRNIRDPAPQRGGTAAPRTNSRPRSERWSVPGTDL